MKLSLAGSSYENRSLSAAAQICLNLYQETIEDKSGSGKGTSQPLNSAGQAEASPAARILCGTPGFHLLANLNSNPGVTRGAVSGGGRLFVAVGPLVGGVGGTASLWIYEINNAGSVVASQSITTTPNGFPVQLIPNGNQLGMVADGQFYIDNGTGFEPARFSIERLDLQMSPANTAQCWDDTNPFTAADAGNTLEVIAGDGWTIQTVSIVSVSTVAGKSMATCSISLGSVPGANHRSGTLTIDATNPNAVSDSSTAFTQADVGQMLQITGGTGFTPVITTIVAVDASGNAVCDLALGTPGSTGGSAWEFPPSPTGDALEIDQTAGGLVTAVTGVFLDGSYYVQRPIGGNPDLGRQVNFSGVFDGTSWNAADFFTKESASDHIQSILADREMLFVFGQELETEIWQNSPATGRPVLVSGAVAQEPSAAAYVPVTMQEKIYYIGASNGGGPVAYEVTGFSPVRISTHAVEDQWKENGVNISQAVGWFYEDEGHWFWVVWFPQGSAWVYDATEKTWHERRDWNGSGLGPYRPWWHCYLPTWHADSGATQGLHIVGDSQSAKVLIMNLAYGDSEGVAIFRQRALPYLYSAGRRVFVGRVDLAMEPGPTVSLDFSGDDGATWSQQENGTIPPNNNGGQNYWLAPQGSWDYSAIPRITIIGDTPVTLVELDAEVSYGQC